MQTIQWQFYNEIRSRVEEARDGKVSSLAAGLCHSYEDYKMIVGHVAALNDVLALMDDVRIKITGED